MLELVRDVYNKETIDTEKICDTTHLKYASVDEINRALAIEFQVNTDAMKKVQGTADVYQNGRSLDQMFFDKDHNLLQEVFYEIWDPDNQQIIPLDLDAIKTQMRLNGAKDIAEPEDAAKDDIQFGGN